MVNANVRAALAAAVLVGAAPIPLAAAAATPSDSQQLVRWQMNTRFFDPQRPGAIEGKLTLTVYASGIVEGSYFRADAQDQLRNMTGNDPGNIWLELGGADAHRPNGTLPADAVVDSSYFRADAQEQLRNVSGGVDGEKIWLEIDGAQALRLTGTFKAGMLHATTFVRTFDDAWVFESTKSVRLSNQ